MRMCNMQVYVRQSDKAIAFYQKAFGAPVVPSDPNAYGVLCTPSLMIMGRID